MLCKYIQLCIGRVRYLSVCIGEILHGVELSRVSFHSVLFLWQGYMKTSLLVLIEA